MTDQAFIQRLVNGAKEDCPCCGRYAQMYDRKLYATIGRKLIKLYRLGGATEYVHTSRLVEQGETGIGDFGKARYWNFIEEQPITQDNKKKSGYWKLTAFGVDFVTGRIRVASRVMLFDDRVYGFSEELINIRECLESGGFNYNELMSA